MHWSLLLELLMHWTTGACCSLPRELGTRVRQSAAAAAPELLRLPGDSGCRWSCCGTSCCWSLAELLEQ